MRSVDAGGAHESEDVSVSQFNTGPALTTQGQGRPGADLYSVLLIIAAALLFAATIYVAAKSYQLFGTLLPPSGG